jgi:drug/metabolite transporter (DMT)-like permease
VRLVPAAEALVLAQTEAIFGPLWVWLVFREQPTEAALLGGLVLFAAVLVQATGGFRRRAKVIPPAAEQP